MSEIIRVANTEILECTKKLQELLADGMQYVPQTREELFAGSLPLLGSVSEACTYPQVQAQSFHHTSQPVLPEVQPVEEFKTTPFADNVLQVLVDHWKSMTAQHLQVEPISGHKLRDLIKPANRPVKQGKEGPSFTALVQKIPGVRVVSMQREKNGNRLQPEPGFLLSDDAISFLRSSK